MCLFMAWVQKVNKPPPDGLGGLELHLTTVPRMWCPLLVSMGICMSVQHIQTSRYTSTYI